MSKNEKAVILIPARLASERLPSKPLARINEEAMIVHIARRAVEASLGAVYVAAGDEAIVAEVEQAGFQAILTDPDLPSGSDRCVAALKTLNEKELEKIEVVINLQGDMPNISPATIKEVYQAFTSSGCDCATLVHPCAPEDEQNPNLVKAVLALEDTEDYPRCLYFSRECLPAGQGRHWGHCGIYAWRLSSLLEFARLPPSPLEQREKLEQLRALEHQMVIRAGKINNPPLSVDTPEDLAEAKEVMEQR